MIEYKRDSVQIQERRTLRQGEIATFVVESSLVVDYA